MPEAHSIQVYDDVSVAAGLSQFFYAEHVYGKPETHLRVETWVTDVEDVRAAIAPPHPIHASEVGEHFQSVYATVGGAHCYLTLGAGHLTCNAAGETAEQAAQCVETVKRLVPKSVPGVEQKIGITFWSASRHGPMPMLRKIDVPTFDQIRDNYSADVEDQLDALMDSDFRPARGGQLLLLHGPPGTGKTYALRALAWEWRKWARFQYITDPDKFFGDQADYMMRVSVHDDELDEYEDHSHDDGADKAWRLLLLEDASELLAADAREKTGQGLSRLLNLVDGLIGQGLRILVLVTTNEPLGKLHPAIARPGRCAAQIRFEGLAQEEADEWLELRGLEPQGRPMTLAQLYALADGVPVDARDPVGFAR